MFKVSRSLTSPTTLNAKLLQILNFNKRFRCHHHQFFLTSHWLFLLDVSFGSLMEHNSLHQPSNTRCIFKAVISFTIRFYFFFSYFIRCWGEQQRYLLHKAIKPNHAKISRRQNDFALVNELTKLHRFLFHFYTFYGDFAIECWLARLHALC